jgi:uncharacterized protein (TIGR00255 family)
MTAYSRVSIETEIGHFFVEIQSVNRKFLEVNTFLPRDLLRFDGEIKKWISNALSRGQLNVKVSMTPSQKKTLSVLPNLPLARELKSAWDKIAKELNLSTEQGFNLEMLVKEPGILQYEEDLQDEDLYRKYLQEAVEMALKELNTMKQREGKNLQHDILQRWESMSASIQKIESKAQNAVQKYRQKLVERLEEVLPGRVENEDKILREVSLYAEKIDVSEEFVRFKSHLGQFKDTIESDSYNAGKTLEFIVQELNREINTIGSKSADAEITRVVIDVKSELERIREQIQNVE